MKKLNLRQKQYVKAFLSYNLTKDGKEMLLRKILFNNKTRIDYNFVFEVACDCFPDKKEQLTKTIKELI